MPSAFEPAPPRRFVTVESVATMLSLPVDDVESMIGSGELPAIRLGPADEWRIEESVLNAFLEAKYEETRRSALWGGFDFSSIAEFDPERRRITRPHENRDVD